MLKPGSVKKEKRRRKRDREIDLESVLSIPVLPQRPWPKVLLSYSKSPSSPVNKEQRVNAKWLGEHQKERGRRGRAPTSCVAWPAISNTRSFYLTISHPPPPPSPWGRRPKQKDALYLPKYDAYNVTLMSVAPSSDSLQDPRTLAKMSRVAKNRGKYSFGRLPWNGRAFHHHQQQQLGTQQSPCHLTLSQPVKCSLKDKKRAENTKPEMG